MIPILYEKNETGFISNGLGRLADAKECIVTEERNGAYELHMEYPVDGIHFSEIAIGRFIYAEPADGKDPQPFRIYAISKPLNGIVEVDAEHISYQLSHIPVSPFTASSVGAALTGLKNNAAETCPFTFWTDKTTAATFKVEVPVSIRSMLGGSQGSILDVFGGGEFEFDCYDVKFYQNRGSNRGVTLRYGKNITDIKQEESIASTYTGVMPYWKGTDENSNEVLVMLTEKVLHSSNAANFPYQRTIPLDMSSSFEAKPTEAQLRSAAQSYMSANNIGVPSVSIDVSFVALWQTEEYKDIANLERVNLCDTVTVQFETLGISATAKVVKTEYDVLRERYRSIEVGDARNSLARTVKGDIAETTENATKTLPTKTFMKQAIDYASRVLAGGLGGHVILKTNADGEPEEILVMDTDDVNTAVNVIRINLAGIGFSTAGYAGPYTTAWTIDGRFNADFITTGSLMASLITSGIIRSQNGKVYFDLDGNEIACNKIVCNIPTNNETVSIELVTDSSSGMFSQTVGAAYIKLASHSSNTKGINFILRNATSAQDPSMNLVYTENDLAICGRQAGALNHIINSIVFRQSLLEIIGPSVGNRLLFRPPSNSNYTTGDVSTSNFVAGNIRATNIDVDNITSEGEKPRVVNMDDFGKRLLYCYEMPSPMFGDIGCSKIDDHGISVIYFDDMFAKAINSNVEYQVFLQKEGQGDLWVTEKHKNYFVIQGTPEMEFSWEIKAKQFDHAATRLESFRPYFEETDNENDILITETLYDDELGQYISEQEEILYETA